MVDLSVLHIDLLRRTFDLSVMKIFQRVQEIWSGQESVTEGLTDGRTYRRTDRRTDGQTDGRRPFLQSPIRFAVGD